MDGEIKDGKLIAGNTAGTIKITAQKGKAKTTISMDILSAPNEIIIEPKTSYIEKNETVKFNITAKNKNGYYASIKNSELTWNIISGDGEIKDGTFTPSKEGIHLIEIAAGNAKSYSLVNVSEITETSGEIIKENVTIPKDIKGIDSANKESTNSGDGVIKIAIYDAINTPTILLDKLKNSKIENAINKISDLVILTSQEDENTISNITKPIIKTSSYSKTSYENTDIITIDVTNGGLRNTDYKQWLNLKNDIKNSKNKNILILMKGSLKNFVDEAEKKLFIDAMCEIKRSTLKNIWILNEGDYTDYSMERGIRYLSVNNQNFNINEPIEVAKDTSYILITIDENNLTYEIKNVF